jgi:hypothetical protein
VAAAGESQWTAQAWPVPACLVEAPLLTFPDDAGMAEFDPNQTSAP